MVGDNGTQEINGPNTEDIIGQTHREERSSSYTSTSGMIKPPIRSIPIAISQQSYTVNSYDNNHIDHLGSVSCDESDGGSDNDQDDALLVGSIPQQSGWSFRKQHQLASTAPSTSFEYKKLSSHRQRRHKQRSSPFPGMSPQPTKVLPPLEDYTKQDQQQQSNISVLSAVQQLPPVLPLEDVREQNSQQHGHKKLTLPTVKYKTIASSLNDGFSSTSLSSHYSPSSSLHMHELSNISKGSSSCTNSLIPSTVQDRNDVTSEVHLNEQNSATIGGKFNHPLYVSHNDNSYSRDTIPSSGVAHMFENTSTNPNVLHLHDNFRNLSMSPDPDTTCAFDLDLEE